MTEAFKEMWKEASEHGDRMRHIWQGLKTVEAHEDESPHALPTFRGWTVDLKLKEFRRPKMKRGEPAGIEFLRFDTVQGDSLLADWLRTPEGVKANREGRVEF